MTLYRLYFIDKTFFVVFNTGPFFKRVLAIFLLNVLKLNRERRQNLVEIAFWA